MPLVCEMSRIWIDAAARELIAVEAVRRRFRETGGTLFGYRADDDFVIAHAKPPGARAKHRRTRYLPHVDDVQEEIDEVFLGSEGAFRYLGEWHTHPGGRAVPSATDERSAERIATASETDLAEPVVLIQATAPMRIHVSIAKLMAYRWSMKQGCLLSTDLTVATIDSALVRSEGANHLI